jgi:hypothetical protein
VAVEALEMVVPMMVQELEEQEVLEKVNVLLILIQHHL